MEEYVKNGQEIFDTYCSPTMETSPIMLPRAPHQTYIDLYPDPDPNQPGPSFHDDIRRQKNYEAEVVVYRTLEKVKGNFIVLHNFKYTHHQYRLCDRSHVRKGCQRCNRKNAANKHGECDFLIIGQGYFVIIEVKDMTNIAATDQSEVSEGYRVLKGTFDKSLEQRERMVKLIQSIDQGMTVLHFTAYPNFSKQFRNEFQLTENDLSSIIFKDDLESIDRTSLLVDPLAVNNYDDIVSCCPALSKFLSSLRNTTSDVASDVASVANVGSFSAWWEEKVNSVVLNESQREEEFVDRFKKVRNMLLAIWCTDKDICDKERCSLGRCVAEMDEKLRSGRFTFRSNNPGVIGAPSVIRDYIGVHNLTEQQYSAFNSKEKLLWINGPAGAGKSVLLCGKIIEVIRSDEENKVVLFKSNSTKATQLQLYQDSFDKADVIYKVIIFTRALGEQYTPSELIALIAEKTPLNHQVLILEMKSASQDETYIPRLINKMGDFKYLSVFFDDFQQVFLCILPILKYTLERCTLIIDNIIEISRSITVWVACDLVQYSYITHNVGLNYPGTDIATLLVSKLSSNQLITLSKNLRNTCDLSNILSVLRDSFITETEDSNRSNLILPKQIAGHYLHGPKTVIHVLNDFNDTLIGEIVGNELDKLYQNNKSITLNDILVCGNINKDRIVKKGVFTLDNLVIESEFADNRLYSSQWPAAVILEITFNTVPLISKLTRLYLRISRARVYCCVILIPNNVNGPKNEETSLLLRKLKDFAQIIEH